MGTTPTYLLPYPEATDPADVPIDMKELAERIEAIVRPTVVTVLPATPYDGQEVYLYVGGHDVMWHFRYRGSAPGAHKWEFLGGPPLRAVFNTPENIPAGGPTFYDLPGGPAIAVPRAGEYDAVYSGRVQGTGGMSVQFGTVTAAVGDDGFFVPSDNSSEKTVRGVVATAGQTIKTQYQQFSGNATTVIRRALAIRPIRVS